MKKNISIILFITLIGVFAASTQTISNSVIPVAPYTLLTQTVDTTGINPGASGAGQTWNFSKADILDFPVIVNYVLPDTTKNDSIFHNATVAVSNTTLGGYTYLAVNDSQEVNLGYWDSTGIFPYTFPETLLAFPYSFGDTNISSWVVNYSYPEYLENIYTNGITTVIANAWGTILTPAGNMDSVVRIKVTRNYQDSTFTSGNFVGANTYSYTYYSWYKEGYQGYLFNISYPLIRNGNDTLKPESVSYQYSAPATGINSVDKADEVSLFPNPAHNFIDLTVQLKNNGSGDISLVNMIGQTVYNSGELKYISGSNFLQIPVSELSSGTYLLHYTGDNACFTKKIIIK